MGLDTYVVRAKSARREDWDTDEAFNNAAYFRKCYGIDSALCRMSTQPIIDQCVWVIDREELEVFLADTKEKAAKIVEVCNNYKAFPYRNVLTINDLDDLDIDFYNDDEMYQLYRTIESIAGEAFADDQTIWGTVHTICMAIYQFSNFLATVQEDDVLILISSY